jgi:hypothetical protein
MYMPASQAKKLAKGVSDETEVSDLQGTLAGTSRPTSRVNAPTRPLLAGVPPGRGIDLTR